MCGRYNLTSSVEDIITALGLDELGAKQAVTNFKPRYNIVPGQDVPIVRLTEDGKALTLARWGLIPHWSKEPKTKYSTINARAESVAEKPIYREPFRHKRCLIPATGFYEWQRQDDIKIPHHICMRDGGVFVFAGLWDHWEKEGAGFDSCSIIVTSANQLMQLIHERMPVILPPSEYDTWLDTSLTDKESLTQMLRPYSDAPMRAYPVSLFVNSPKNDSPDCIRPA
jgi:putative SOS response-associated peptidase YedK